MSKVFKSTAAAPSGSNEQEDLALLLRIARGDRAAFDRLYLSYYRRLFGFLMRFPNCDGVVEEIINDTLFVVWRKAAGFRGHSRVSTWILGIAYHRAQKSLKGLRDEPSADGADYAPEALPLMDISAVPDCEMEDWIAHGLAQLPMEQRTTLELAYFYGHSCEEIAEITSVPVNTVKTRMFNARRRLRELLPLLAGATSLKSPTT